MKNILHIVNIYFVIPFFLGKQIDHFKAKGYNMHIICSPSEQLASDSELHGYQYKEIEILRKISMLKDLKAVFKTYKYIRKENINIVTGHTPKGGIIAMLAAFLACVPIRIYFRHGLVYETSRGLKRCLLVMIDRIASVLATKVVCVSPSVYEQSLMDKLGSEKKQVILSRGTCNGIDINKFNRSFVENKKIESLRKKLNISENSFVIGFSGRLVTDKGISELVNAYRLIKRDCNDVKLLLIGMFEERDGLSIEIVNEIKKDESILCTGCVDYEIIQNYYALMDIFVLPSYREGFPTSVLEASSMELPVITTKVTGCVDSIIDQVTGIFVSHEVNKIKDSILYLYENPEKRRDYGKNGRQFVIDNFDQCIIWNEIEKLYVR